MELLTDQTFIILKDRKGQKTKKYIKGTTNNRSLPFLCRAPRGFGHNELLGAAHGVSEH